jgi:hypothetical protein
MKTNILATVAAATIIWTTNTPKAGAQDATAALLMAGAGAGGYALGEAFKDQWKYAPIVGAAVLPPIVNWGYSVFKNKNDEEKIKYYLSGRNYERWMQSQETWYQSTLDPHTGRPQAFSGLTEMNAGMPPMEGTSQQETPITQVYTAPVRLPAGTYQGVPYTERIQEFPKLP